MPSWKELKSAVDYREVLDQHDTLLFDCDGVIWTGGSADELCGSSFLAMPPY